MPPLTRATLISFPRSPARRSFDFAQDKPRAWSRGSWLRATDATGRRLLALAAALGVGIGLVLVQVGRQTPGALGQAAAFHRQHLRQQRLGAGRALAPQMTLVPLGPYELAGPGQAKALGGRLVRLGLELPL